jgi:hypothetical protein
VVHVPAGALMVLITQTRTGVNMLLFPSRFDKTVVDKEAFNKSQMQVREAAGGAQFYAPRRRAVGGPHQNACGNKQAPSEWSSRAARHRGWCAWVARATRATSLPCSTVFLAVDADFGPR